MTKALKKKEVGTDLTEGKVLTQLCRYVLPMLLANLVQQLYNTVDIIIIGQYVGSTGTVGVSTGGEVAALVTFIASGFGSAAQIYIAQLFGAHNKKAVSEMIVTSIIFMAILAVVCTAISIVGCDLFLSWLNCPEEAFSQAKSYMLIVSLGLPFVFGYNVVCGILRGMGESKRPLLFVVVAAIANLFMDLLFVAVIPLEAAGTAIATVCAQFASFAAAMIFMLRRREALDLGTGKIDLCISRKHLRVFLRLGIPLVAETMFIHCTQIICSAQINSFGLVASATNSIGNKVQRLVNIVASSVSHGGGAMVGQSLGAKKYDRVKEIVYTQLACSAVLTVIGISAALLLPRQLFRLFTIDPQVIEFGVTYMRIATIIFILTPVQGSFGSVVTGSGNMKLNFYIGLLDGVILRLGISFLFAYELDMGVIGFFYGNTLARLGPVVLSTVYFYSGKWKKRKLLYEENNEEKRT